MHVETTRNAPGAARAAEAGQATGNASERCANCGAAATGNYCPNCGQETSIALPTAGAFLREAAGRYVKLDGRMWRSLYALLFHPGLLTREYFAGRRRRYVRPARLFVALSIVLFAVLRFTGEASVLVGAEDRAGGGRADSGSSDVEARGGMRVDPQFDFGPMTAPALAPLRRRLDAFNRLSREQKSEQLRAGALRYAPYAAIGLLPLFALIMKVVYAGGGRRHPRRPRRYAAHLVFGAHIHAFLFLAATLMALIEFSPIRAALACWMVVYALLSLNTVYGGGWLGVVARASVIAIVYFMLFSLAVAAVFAAAVMLG